MKDNFSQDSGNYGKFRPTYPEELYNYILTKVKSTEMAWDCATGNGQVASKLSDYFKKVEATDLSNNQLEYAIRKTNITYSRQVAELTNFPGHHFDLITVGQALHWFNFDAFFNEVKRVLKPEGVFVAFVYGLNTVGQEVDEIINDFYHKTIGPYWDDERRYIDDQYQSINFPFNHIEHRKFEYQVAWDVEHYFGYLNTWSAVKHFIKANNFNPVLELEKQLRKAWGNGERTVVFPIFLVCACK